jgi:hypothetical protein
MRSVELLYSLAEPCHQDLWDLQHLPTLLGAELCIRPGGRKILGFMVRLGPLRQIVLNQRICDLPIEKPVLAHECAHILFGHEGVHICAAAYQSRQEREAWYGAAMLAIPPDAARALQVAEARPGDVAKACDAPVELVGLRLALGDCLDAFGTPRERARNRLRAAWRRWMDWLEQAATSL